MSNKNSAAGFEERLRRQAAERREQLHAPAWRPDVGDTLLGRIIGFGSAKTKFDKVARIVTVEDSRGDRHSVWLSGKVIADEFEKTGADVGDGIYFERLEDGGDGRYRRFQVLADRDGEGL